MINKLNMFNTEHKSSHKYYLIEVEVEDALSCAVGSTSNLNLRVCRSSKHSFIEIGLEVFSTAILSLPLILVGELSVLLVKG